MKVQVGKYTIRFECLSVFDLEVLRFLECVSKRQVSIGQRFVVVLTIGTDHPMMEMCLECLNGAGNLKKKTKYLRQRNPNLDLIYVDPLEERKKVVECYCILVSVIVIVIVLIYDMIISYCLVT